MVNQPRILLLYTGGTIGMIKKSGSNTLQPFNFSTLLDNIPELKLLECYIKTVSFETPIDSSNMEPKYWNQICKIVQENYPDFDGFVILHGSDTMSYTASAISFLLENLSKPIIFTGSQLPIGDLRTDAKENLITSIQLATLQKDNRPLIKEVCLYFEYKLYRGNRTTKISASNFEAFASPNYPSLAVSGVSLQVLENNLMKFKNKPLIVHQLLDSKILIIHLFPGIDEELLKEITAISSYKAIILKTFGSGNAPNSSWFINMLNGISQKKIPIINVSQCISGSVQMGNYETSIALKEIGVVSAKDMTLEAAITKTMYLLGQNLSLKVFRTIFETPIRGEML